MIPRGRTSVLDLWSENKGTEKEWFWVNEWCWLGLLGGELHLLWFSGCSCSPIQCCNLRWFWVLCLGTFGTPCVLSEFVSATSIDSVGHAPAATGPSAVNCHEHAAHLCYRQTVCRVGWGAVSRRDDLTKWFRSRLEVPQEWRQVDNWNGCKFWWVINERRRVTK